MSSFLSGPGAAKALLLFLLATIAVTHPLVGWFDSAIYGIGHDNLGQLWLLWARHKIIFEGADPQAFDWIFYPAGKDLTQGLLMYTFDAYIWLFALVAKNAVVAYNLMLITRWVLAAWAMFLLLRALVDKPWAAWWGGFLYAFNPYSFGMMKAYGPGFMSAFLPFLALAIWRFGKQPSLARAALVGLAFAAFFGENYYLSYFVCVSILLAVPAFCLIVALVAPRATYRYLCDWAGRHRTAIKRIAYLVPIAAVGTAVAGYALSERLAGLIAQRKFDVSLAAMLSTEWVQYFVPAMDNSVFGGQLYDFYWQPPKRLEVYERAQYLGFVPIVLALLGIGSLRRLPIAQRAVGIFLAVLTAASIVMALGVGIGSGGLGAVFFELAPMFRFIARYHHVTMFAFVAIVAFGLAWTMTLKAARWRRIVVAATLTLCLVEYLSVDARGVLKLRLAMPKAYRELMRQPGDFAIAEFPNHEFVQCLHYYAWQTLHGKKSSNDPQDRRWSNPLDRETQEAMRNARIRYVVINRVLPRLTYPPLQNPMPQLGWGDFPTSPSIGYLRLEKSFPDSALYSLADEWIEPRAAH